MHDQLVIDRGKVNLNHFNLYIFGFVHDLIMFR